MELVKNKEKNAEYKNRARELVEKMTLSEKISQMLSWSPAIERLGIPEYNWWNEALHGVARAGIATIFPQAIGLAATFDEDLLEEVADAISTEGRAKYNMQKKYSDEDIYKGLTFWAPNVNIFRDPRWGRGHETYGEDPYLTSRLGIRFVEGIQGHDENYMKSAGCAKHFAVHSGPEDERHHFNAVASKQDMYETYLPAFKALVKQASVEAVMGAYNSTNGEPCCGSKTLLKDILRDKWGFEGHVVSDCWAIKDFHEGHMVTSGPVESVAMAVNNGCDINCGNLFTYLEDAVKQGLVTEHEITEAVVRLYTTRMKLGMFDEKTPFDKIGYDVVDSKEMRELNRKTAEKCVVLLKNKDNLLPLDKNKIKCVGVIGPNADNRRALVGNYEGTAARYVTISEGIQDYLGEDVRVMVSDGCHLYKDRFQTLSKANDRLSEVKGVCEQADVIIACMGLDSGLEGEEGDQGNQFASGDKPNLNLPGNQEEILKVMVESGKPVVLVLLCGSAMAINYADKNVDAILQGWYPGAEGGNAVARVLFGDACPEGKLPITFYNSTEELPDFKDYSMKNRTYRYMTQKALYPFGYGLSYTDFKIDNVNASKNIVDENGINISLDIENIGSMCGSETIQIYVKANRENTPNAQLKAFKKVQLKPNEKKSVSINIPIDAFALANQDGDMIVEIGEYMVYVGSNQPDERSIELTGKTPKQIACKCTKSVIID